MTKHHFKEKKRIVVKIGSNSLMHEETGRLDYIKLERLAMELSDLRNGGRDVCLVSSGAIAVGRNMLGLMETPKKIPQRQALAAVGQGRLVSIYQRFLSEFNQDCGQVLMTKNTMLDNVSRKNAQNTFEALFEMGVIPVVNENDTVSTSEIKVGDNDTLSAIVTSLIGADLLILLSDVDGLYNKDPKEHTDAKLIKRVEQIDEKLREAASGKPGSTFGTGGMTTKLRAAEIATYSGADMIIANSADVSVLHRILDNDFKGTTFAANYKETFDLLSYIEKEV